MIRIYLGVAAFSGLFGVLYEQFSHGVYSPFMVGFFLFPLLGGTGMFVLLKALGGRCPSENSLHLWHCGLATLTVGSCLRGVFDIYGTYVTLVNAYWAVGIGMLLLAAGLYLRQCRIKSI